jgi:hypothetical protein
VQTILDYWYRGALRRLADAIATQVVLSLLAGRTHIPFRAQTSLAGPAEKSVPKVVCGRSSQALRSITHPVTSYNLWDHEHEGNRADGYKVAIVRDNVV